MTLFRFKEARESRGGTNNPPSETRVYKASGSNDPAAVRVLALGLSPALVAHESGTLYRQDIQVDAVGFEQAVVTVPYGPRQKASGSYTIDFDTTGGTVHITNSKETISKLAAPNKDAAPDFGGALVVEDGEVRGTEMIIPALRFTVTFRHPEGVITIPQIKNLARWTGKQNSASFFTFDEGEALFLGARGREGTDAETEISYEFAMSENTINQTVGDIVGVDKKGWEFSWIWYEHTTDAGPPELAVRKPRWLYVERIYEKLDFATAFGFGD